MFTHLHTHTEYSLLDGLSTIPDLVARAKALGQDALAITDHGNLHGALQFYEEARANGIKPIIGLEGYVAPGSRFDAAPPRARPSTSPCSRRTRPATATCSSSPPPPTSRASTTARASTVSCSNSTTRA